MICFVYFLFVFSLVFLLSQATSCFLSLYVLHYSFSLVAYQHFSVKYQVNAQIPCYMNFYQMNSSNKLYIMVHVIATDMYEEIYKNSSLQYKSQKNKPNVNLKMMALIMYLYTIFFLYKILWTHHCYSLPSSIHSASVKAKN